MYQSISHLIHPCKVKKIFFLKWHIHCSSAVTDRNKESQSEPLKTRLTFYSPNTSKGEKKTYN